MRNSVMTTTHPRWDEFAERLCDTTPLDGCNHTTQDTEAVLAAMGDFDIEGSLAGFRAKGRLEYEHSTMLAPGETWLTLSWCRCVDQPPSKPPAQLERKSLNKAEFIAVITRAADVAWNQL